MKTNELFDIEGKIALVTGSTGGLGEAFAKVLYENGAIVILYGRDVKKLEAQTLKFKESGDKVFGYPFYLSNAREILKN